MEIIVRHVFGFGLLVLLLTGCKSGSSLSGRYSGEDREVFELIERLRKDPGDRDAARMLPETYQKAVDSARQRHAEVQGYLAPGDRELEKARQLEVMRKMYDEIITTPAAYRQIPHPWNPEPEIKRSREAAAREYYNQGMAYLGYNNRSYAARALEQFNKANNAVPGFMDVKERIQEAQQLAMIHVVVLPVNYNRYGFSQWGFEQDFLQNQMVRDLNASSFRDVRFYTERDARIRYIQADKVVDLNIPDFFISQVNSTSRNYERTRQIEVGESRSIPPKPVYETARATVTVYTKILQGNCSLECRIFDRATGGNLYFDRFPGTYAWRYEWATFRGDRRALTPGDLALISNPPGGIVPSRNEVAAKLIDDSYFQLLNSIKAGVRFY